ncbi:MULTISPECIES: HAD-IIIC family phosphatase [unclassified Rhizobium]|uniref:HAD-IIIC family phosphatase n=1 Tax=unclassified Rhizobium TaxID=2613769 RepID=UPI00288C3EB2|nr:MULTISPECIES: HAD-IIIC family phosphatase [unclassified Rhizobium]
MDTSDFLFPRDLEINPTKFGKFLIIGSCMSEILRDYYRWKHPSTQVDHILFNGASDIPEPPSQLGDYDFQIIQMPVRSVVSDAVIDIGRLKDAEFAKAILQQGVNSINAMLDAALKFNARNGLLTFVTNFVVPQRHLSSSIYNQNTHHDVTTIISELNAYLAHRVRDLRNVYLVDIEMIASSVGKRFFLDDNIGFSTHGSVFHPAWEKEENEAYWTAPMPGRMDVVPSVGETYPSNAGDFYDAVLRQIEAIFRTVNQIDQVKMVIFDLDNTLWRGQLVEHYQNGLQWPTSDGWPLGVWEAVQHLKSRGIILAICSKNDHQHVVDGWSKAVNTSWISLDDFPIQRINWEPKSANIESIMRDASLTPKSVLFVDDNPVERASVQAAFPGIRTIGSDPFVIRRLLMWSPELQVAKLSKESEDRATAILGQIDREKSKTSLSREDFLQSLDSVLTFDFIRSPSDTQFDRSLELLNKTNQFNTTGKRWTFQDISEYLDGGGLIATFSVNDRFVSYGLVGVMLIKDGNFDQFAMSCRVLGMGIEVGAIHYVMQNLGWMFHTKKFTADFKLTSANSVCKDFYQRAGFAVSGDGLKATYGPTNPREAYSHLTFDDRGIYGNTPIREEEFLPG